MKENEFAQLRNTLKKVASSTQDNLKFEKVQKWPVYESRLVGNESTSFESEFRFLYPEEFLNIREYIETFLQEKKGHAIGIEIGGTASRLFRDFTPGFYEETLGIALMDGRNKFQKDMDEKSKHSVLTGDIFSPSIVDEIKNKLSNRKVNVIFEKMDAALLDFPESLEFLGLTLNRWYKLLDDKGIMFLQGPPMTEKSQKMNKIRNILNKISEAPGISLSYELQDDEILNKQEDKNNTGVSYFRIKLRLQRNQEAPADLNSLLK